MSAFVKSVEWVSTTFDTTSGATSNDISLTKGQDETMCVPFYTAYTTGSGTDFRENDFFGIEMVDVTGTPTVRVHRNATATVSTKTVSVFVVEFDTNCTVTQGTAALTGTTASASLGMTISATNAWCIATQVRSSGSSDDFNDTMVATFFNTTTTIDFQRGAAGTPDWTMYWYAVRSDDGSFVNETKTGSWTSGQTGPTNHTLSNSLTVANSFIIPSYYTSETADDLRDAICNFALTGTTTLTWYRNNNGSPAATGAFNCFCVRATSTELTSQRFALDLAASTTNDQTITEVDTSRSIVMNSGYNGGAWSTDADTVGSNIEDRQNALFFQSVTTVRAQQQQAEASAGADSRLRFEVIEFELAASDTNVNANVDALILTEQQATVNAETNVNAGVDALTLTESQSTVNAETNVNANVANLTLTENQATIKADTSVSAGVDALTLTEQAADVNLDKFVSAGTVALTLTEQAATVNAETNVNTNIDALVLTENQASIKADTNIAANVASLALTENQSTVSLGVVVDATVVNLTLTEQSASVNAETNVNTNVDALVLTENQASVKADTIISAGVDALTLTALQSGVNAETNVNTNIDALSLTTFSATVEAGTDTNVNASVANLTLTEQSARVNAGTNINAGIDVLILSENKANVSYIVDGETVTSSGGANFQARPTQEAIDKWLAQELDPNVPVKVKVREFAPQLEQSDPSLFEDLVSARQAIEQFQRPLLPSEIEKVRDGFVSITDLLPDYRLDETEEEAIVLLMMM